MQVYEMIRSIPHARLGQTVIINTGPAGAWFYGVVVGVTVAGYEVQYLDGSIDPKRIITEALFEDRFRF